MDGMVVAVPYVPALTPVFAIAMVTGAEPLKLVPLRPVPIVSVLVVDAVTVVDPPSDTKLPLMVIELLVNWLLPIPLNVPPRVRLPLAVTEPVSVMPLTEPVPATEVTVPTLTEPPSDVTLPLMVMVLLVSEPLPMLVSVLLAPLIVLLVSVCDPASETASVMPYPAIVVGVDVMDDHAGVTVVLLAAVSWPWALTVKMPTWVAEPYVPAVTAVFAREIVPDDVIGPPVRPVPVSISVTVPPAIADAVLIDVMRPKESTVTTGIAVVEPKVPVDVPVAIKLMVGLPVEASPLVTPMLPVVPTIALDVNEPPLTPSKPVELDVD